MSTPIDADPALAEQLRLLEESLLQSEVRRSSTALDDLLADDFIEIGSSGRVFDKARIISALREESARRSRAIRDFRVRILAPSVVLATYRLIGRDGDAPPRHTLRSSIWKRAGERWQMVFHQGTLSRAP
jgi:hypothetical protein